MLPSFSTQFIDCIKVSWIYWHINFELALGAIESFPIFADPYCSASTFCFHILREMHTRFRDAHFCLVFFYVKLFCFYLKNSQGAVTID